MESETIPESVLSDLDQYYYDKGYISFLFQNITSDSTKQSLERKTIYFSRLVQFLCHINDDDIKVQYIYMLLIIIRCEYKSIKALSSDGDKMEHRMFLQDCLIESIIKSCFTIGPIDIIQKLLNKIILTAIKIKSCLRDTDFSVFEAIPNQIMHHLVNKIYPLDTQLLKIAKKLIDIGFINDGAEKGKDFSLQLSIYIKELFSDEHYKTACMSDIIICIDIVNNYYSKTKFLRKMFKNDFSLIITGLTNCMHLGSARVQPKYLKLQNIAFAMFLDIRFCLEPIELLKIVHLISNKCIIIEFYSEKMHEFLKAMIEDFYEEFCVSIWRAYINIANVNDITAIDFMIFFIEYCERIEEEKISMLLNLFSSILSALERWINMYIQTSDKENDLLSGDFIYEFIERLLYFVQFNRNIIIDLFDDDLIEDFNEVFKYLHSIFGFDIFVDIYNYLMTFGEEE